MKLDLILTWVGSMAFIFRTRLDPNVNSIDVGTACNPADSQDKNHVVLLNDLTAAPLL